MTSNITIFKNIRETQTPFYRNITEILQRIKDGASKNLVKEIQPVKLNTLNRLNKSKSWKYGYDPNNDIVVIIILIEIIIKIKLI